MRLAAYVRGLLARRRIERELAEELRFHLEQEIASHVARGVPSKEARRMALRDFGSVTAITESVRDLRTAWPESLWRELRFAWRRLRREPAFSFTAAFTLALGIGANIGIFSILDSLLLRPLPVRDPKQLVEVMPGGESAAWTYPLWDEFRRRQDVLDGVFAWSTSPVDPTRPGLDLGAGGVADLAKGLWVSGGFFDVLGVRAAVGRTIAPEDDVKGGGADGPVAVVSYGFWQQHYAGAASIVGRRLFIEGVPFTIVGVTPRGFFGPDVGQAFDVAIPLGTLPLVARRDRLQQRTWWWLTVMGRLRSGQSPAAAAAALASLQPALRDATKPAGLRPEKATAYLDTPMRVMPAPAGPSNIRDRYDRPLAVLMVVVVGILLIMCVNLAMLMLARADSRRHEIAMRLALGASRARLIAQCLVETLTLAALGAAGGLVLATTTSRWLIARFGARDGALVLDLGLDGRSLAFTTALTVVVALLFGLVPALHSTTSAPMYALKSQRGAAATGSRRVRSLLLALQVALSLVLTVASLLFVRTLTALTSRPLGFDAKPVLIVTFDPRRSAQPPMARAMLGGRLLDVVRTVPGVADASLSAVTPVSDNEWDTVLQNPPGLSLPEAERRIDKNLVRPRWFATYGIPFVAGRDFTDADVADTPSTVIVNEALARRYYGGLAAIGRRLREVDSPADPQPSLTIVGIVKDAVYLSLREDPPPTMYVPVSMGPGVISIRAQSGPPERLVPTVAAAIAGVDRDVALTVHPLMDDLRSFTARERLLAELSAFFAMLALLVAGLGLYGVVAHAVAARRTEIGIRMALGASARSVVGLTVGTVARPVLVGLLLGLPVSAWAATFASALFFGVGPHDPAVLAAAAMTLLAVGVMACWVPARRAAHLDPAVTLRAE